jgi:hypothetical protein
MLSYELAKQLKDHSVDNNPGWKGDNASYYSKHQFLSKNHGKPSECTYCSIKGKKKKGGRWSIQWAKIKNRAYSHDVNDYIALCRTCHSKYDWNDTKTQQMILVAKKAKGTKSVVKSLIATNKKRDERGHFIKA